MTFLPLCQHRSTRYDGPGYTACPECRARFANVGGAAPPSYANRLKKPEELRLRSLHGLAIPSLAPLDDREAVLRPTISDIEPPGLLVGEHDPVAHRVALGQFRPGDRLAPAIGD